MNAASWCLRSRLVLFAAPPCLASAVLLFSSDARADRYVVEEDHDGHGYVEGSSHLDLGLDGEGAVPLGIARSPAGNDVSGGGGFKVRIGDQFRLRHVRVTPEFAYGFDHLFATDSLGESFAWDMHRLMGGARVGFGRVIVPTIYGHLGYGWRDTGDPSVATASGLAFDAGFALDLHLIPHLGIGAHVEYAMIDAQPFTPHWLALGIHGDIAF